MHQVATIIQAVELAEANGQLNAVTAIFKHYLMDDSFVSREVRQDVLEELNKHFNTRYSVTQIKKANPALLNGIGFEMPVKPKLVLVDSIKGSGELPKDFNLIKDLNPKSNTAVVQESNMSEVNVTVTEKTNGDAAAQPVKVQVGGKKAKDKGQAKAVPSEQQFADALAKAVKRGKSGKAEHVSFSALENGITTEGLGEFYKFMKPTIKMMISGFKEIPQMDSAEKREECFTAWIESDKKLGKAYKKFEKAADGQFKKSDTKMAMFLIVAESNIKTTSDFMLYASSYKPESERSDYSFLRENDGGIRTGYLAAGTALILSGVDMFQNGTTVGSLTGAAIGTVASFYVGEAVDSHIDNGFMKGVAAGIIGSAAGIIGTRVGRSLLPSEVLPAYGDNRIIDVNPANSDVERRPNAIIAAIPGLAGCSVSRK